MIRRKIIARGAARTISGIWAGCTTGGACFASIIWEVVLGDAANAGRNNADITINVACCECEGDKSEKKDKWLHV